MIITMTIKRKAVSYRIDERVIQALKDKAKRENNSVNNWLETRLIKLLIEEGDLAKDFQPLGETRGGDTSND